jgi:hypothetical protein
LADPVVDLYGPGLLITNDNWRDDPAQESIIRDLGLSPFNDLESVIYANLVRGASYTAVVRSKDNTPGTALIEIYIVGTGTLPNISTRAFVSTGDDIVIAGFILGGFTAGFPNTGEGRIVVRGIGPSLSALGVPDVLADPKLELRDSNGTLLRANNNWQDDPAQAAELSAAQLQPQSPLESGIAATLWPGAYTALLSGVNDGTGIGLVEVYDRGSGP